MNNQKMVDKSNISKSSLADLRYNLSYYGADYPVDVLVKRMEEEEFIFPNFREHYAWKLDEASKFIESLLLGFPVPSIFFAKDKFSKKLIVIDGQQRLRTLQFFYQGLFLDGKLFRLKNVVPHINGLTYKELALEDKHNLDNTILHCLILAENENSDSISSLFERLNPTLSTQEIRNAIYHGGLNDLLYSFSQSELWKKLYHKNDAKLEAQELILRFISLTFELKNYKENINEFLNTFMLQNRNFEKISKLEIEKIFYNTLEIIFELIGENAFYYNKQFNKSLFETICLVIAKKTKAPDANKIKLLYEKLIRSEEFWQMSKATTSKKSIQTKIDFANYLFELLD